MVSGALQRATSRVLTSTVAGQTTRGTAAFAFAPNSPISAALQNQATLRRAQFWRSVPLYENVSPREFLSYRWSTRNTVQGEAMLLRFLNAVVPDDIPYDKNANRTQSKEEFLNDVLLGVKAAAMAVRITPYVLSRINWSDPRNDPLFRQFIHLKSVMLPDHPKLSLDSLHETADSPVPGLVHRYPDKALFQAVSVCPTYCNYCTRAKIVGPHTELVTKLLIKPTRRRWDQVFDYIAATPQLQDIVVSGGDSYYLLPEHLRYIGERLIGIPHIRRFRFASRGLAVAPLRILDPSDGWAAALAEVAAKARCAGKSVALHTHFNHPNEISWVTEDAAQRLLEMGVPVRNQTVLLRGVNDDVGTMSTLIRRLADNNITPYYVYQCDMVKTIEHMRTPLQTMIDMEAQIRGSIAGFMMPNFIVDLPGGGGKRLGCSYESYDRETGISRFVAPAVTAGAAAVGSGREKPEVFEYHDPVGAGTGAGAGTDAVGDAGARQSR